MSFYEPETRSNKEGIMPGLIPKRRSRQEIERADDRLLRKHKEYLEAWVKSSERPASRQGVKVRSHPGRSEQRGEGSR
jgi:hypothetical protein